MVISSHSRPKEIKQLGAGDIAQQCKCLPGKCKVLSLIRSTKTKTKTKQNTPKKQKTTKKPMENQATLPITQAGSGFALTLTAVLLSKLVLFHAKPKTTTGLYDHHLCLVLIHHMDPENTSLTRRLSSPLGQLVFHPVGYLQRTLL